MSNPKIDHPKVFISYAWGTEEYQDKVLSLAKDLMSDGIDVLIDKWSLKEGHNTYAFMEQCVNDPSITNVLILLDEQYEKKANLKSGGVGTETQIISPEIYNMVKQEKFLPVVFERGVDGNIHKPTYLNGLLHFDLSISEQYDYEYQKIVKRLYGIEIYQKPDLGNIPSWLDSSPIVSTRTRSAYDILKTNSSDIVLTEKFTLFLSHLKDKIIQFKNDDDSSDPSYSKYLSAYTDSRSIRDEFLLLIKYVSYIKSGEQNIANMLEATQNLVCLENGLLKEIKLALLHELFIYVIAIYYKNQNLDGLAYFLGKTYFNNDRFGNRAENFNLFFSSHPNIDNAVNKRDGKKYLSGTAQYWIDSLDTETCSKREFVFADILCFNYAVFGKDYHRDWYWFPITYIYSDHENDLMHAFTAKLQSSEYLSKAAQIFGYDNVQEFNKKFTEIEAMYKAGNFREYRYPSAFERAPILCHEINSESLGALK